VGWLSIALLVISIFMARHVFKNFDHSNKQPD